MHEVERWLESCTAPLSRIGTRLGVQPFFRPGEEVAAQAAVDVLLDHACWQEIEVETIRARLPQLPDIGQSLIAAQARALDLVDLARLAGFLDFYLTAVPHWAMQVALGGAEPPDASTYALLATVRTALAKGDLSEGYSLHESMHGALAPLRIKLSDAQAASLRWRERSVGELHALGVAAAQTTEFLLARAAQGVLQTPGVEQRTRIIRETPEFLVCTLRYDDAALVLLINEQAVEREIEIIESEILDAFAEQIAQANEALERAAQWVAVLDVMLARRAFVVRYDLRRVEITTEQHFVCEDAMYPPLREHIGSRYTPLSLSFDTVAVLSGANMGGKTNALKAAMLIAACARRGLPVPARHARTRLFEQIAWLGDESYISEPGLSAFGREIAAVGSALETAERPCFVVLDEVGSTTSPREGRALLIAMLRGFAARGATVIAATHLERIAVRVPAVHFRLRGLNEGVFAEQYATRAQLLRNLEDAFDRRFVRVDGEEGSSQAFDVARALGLPSDILQYAYEEFSH